MDLLEWLAERQLDVAGLTQPDLEVWLTSGGVRRLDIRYFLTIGHQPVPLPPRLGRLLERVQSEQPKQSRLGRVLPGPRWLFPGVNPGMAVYAASLESKLLRHGISSRHARSAALIGLAADLPSPVRLDRLRRRAGLGSDMICRMTNRIESSTSR